MATEATDRRPRESSGTCGRCKVWSASDEAAPGRDRFALRLRLGARVEVLMTRATVELCDATTSVAWSDAARRARGFRKFPVGKRDRLRSFPA